MNTQLFKELLRFQPVYDPLIIQVNKHFLLDEKGIGIYGRKFGDYVEVLYDRVQVPNQYSNHYGYSCIRPITKHSIIKSSS